jgi:hypothetical protein
MRTLTHTLTPRAGLLGMLAAWLARVPLRLHTFQGEVWVTRHGALRDFPQAQLTAALLGHYRQLLARQGL